MPLPRPSRVPALLGAAALAAALAPCLSPGPARAATLRAAPVLPVSSTDLGYDRIGVRRGDAWRLRDSLDGGQARVYAEQTAGWQPVAGDFDGDGTATVSLFRDGVWLLRNSEGGAPVVVRFGAAGDRAVVGDWDGDGVDTLGLFRHGRWFLRASNSVLPAASRSFGFGVKGDTPVVGDWDADGDTDIAVTRGGTWFQRDAASGGASSRSFTYGRAGDLPIAGDWDHDGRDTPGLFRAGTWYFQTSNGFGRSQTTVFGRAGDRPVVRRTPGLAAGVAHRVVRSGASTAHVASIDLTAASSPDPVLSGGTLGGLERTSSMGRRTGAALAVNGDYFLSSGRPVHALAIDGRLLQTPQLLGRALSLDATGTQVKMGYPDSRVVVSTSDTSTTVSRWNSGGPTGDALVGYTGVGAGLDTPEADRCYAGTTAGPRSSRPDGGVDSTLTVSGSRCYGDAPYVGPTSTVLTGLPGTAGEDLVRSLHEGQTLTTTSYLGFPGAVDVLGGTPLLLVGGRRQDASLSGSGSFFTRQPRTAVGVTAGGRMLVVVVDGRQGAYSAGMTLTELADLMSSLGARDAINLDGGGSSTMYLNGLVANRPSDGYERGVSTALVVLPESDPGQADLRVGPRRSTGSARLTAGQPTAPAPARPAAISPAERAPTRADLVDPAVGWGAAATDPGSIGGLADALTRTGARLPADLRRADALFDRAERVR